ncbi:hypothetical protein VM1G_05436 [Cytospora mali]|uniref:Zn(2)-C6 fungal-type domain-containing protein n=1 Tax=Cytospora mali TaxID=578113 RepID=A0A194VZD5_CYTMA|nr:hypothetical protein VM1G_05436 [Valsa mali]
MHDAAPDGNLVHPPGQPAQQPLRRKRTKERVRVTRACDHCKRQKIRCTGTMPCEVCRRKGNHCSYDVFYSRGRAPSITWDNGVSSTTSPEDNHTNKRGMEVSTQPNAVVDTVSPSASPEPSQTDRQGHYVGPASGASFLLRVQKRVYESLRLPQTSSIFTFGDAPLPDADVSFFLLPPREDTKQLLNRYFDFAVPTHRYLHRPTLEAWFEELYATSGNMDSTEETPARIALLFMVFAQASLYMPASVSSNSVVTDISAQYFLVAEQQLKKERGQVRLASVQARLAQCFYLLSRSRINHCWSLFGTTAHLALAIGLNRGTRTEASAVSGKIEMECRRRVFWCAYTLDKYLAASLGRPRTFREEDIDQQLPSCIDDSSMCSVELQTQRSQGQPVMVAAIAHVKLARILDQILRDLYPIYPITMSSRLKMTLQCTQKLEEWHKELADFLDSDKINTALLLPIYQRQRNVLNAAFWHAKILTYRPFLLRKLGSSGGGKSPAERGSTHVPQVEEGIQECLQAALSICNLVDQLINTEMMFKAFWFTSYYAFCAVVVLYVYTIQQTVSRTQGHQNYLLSAIRCQTQLSKIAEEGSLAERYCLVLEELRKEAVHRSENLQANISAAASIEKQPQQSEPIHQERSVLDAGTAMQHDFNAEQIPDAAGFGTTPGSSVYEISGWGAFDSIATSGFGNLDNLLGNDPFHF